MIQISSTYNPKVKYDLIYYIKLIKILYMDKLDEYKTDRYYRFNNMHMNGWELYTEEFFKEGLPQ